MGVHVLEDLGSFYFYHWTPDHLIFSTGLDVIGLWSCIYVYKLYEKWSFGFIALIGVVNAVGSIIFLGVIANETKIHAVQSIDGALRFSITFDILYLILAIPVIVMPIKVLSRIHKHEKRLKQMSLNELAFHYFESWRIYEKYHQDSDKKRKQFAYKTALVGKWDMYEIKKRDPKLAELIDAYGLRKIEANIAIKQLIEKLGEDTVRPLRKDWEVQEV